ncbi:MAG TPA: outer spore coat protein CotE, partial [Candidatus Pseudogracilibacillus intestinigallinarum]|nr:outer spore coat protein CotE [Candidatus Pseudogracilibacillus intestinigallinarum]
MSFYDHDYREIITKAVCSRGEKKATLSHVLTPTFTPSTILGCWIINHTYEANSKSNKIV